MATGTAEGVAHIEAEDDASIIRERRWLHRVMALLVVLVLGTAVLDGLDVVDAIGPDEATVRASGEGFGLEVEHPSVTRPGLASVFRVTVARDGGFDEPLQVGISRHYLEAWDVNAAMPAPSGETSLGDWVVWEYDPPPGEELVITYEARIEPGVQAGRSGAVAVFVEDEPVVTARFRTQIRP